MPLLKQNELVEDAWVAVGDDEELPEGAPAIVTLARWKRDQVKLWERNAPLGIRLEPGETPHEIVEALERFQLVALNFPAFTDGRAYSYARILRERYGFRGEVRAVGNVLKDQYGFMLRCGFDAFEVPEGTSPAEWAKAARALGVVYQPTSDKRPTAAMKRHEKAPTDWTAHF